MKKFNFRLAFHGEQGGKMLHSTIAKIEKRATGIRKESKKMTCLMETSALQTAPELTRLVPQPKNRNSD